MFLKKFEILEEKLDKINKIIEKNNINDYIYTLGNKKQIFIRNLMAGISRGVGIGIGLTIISAIIIYFLQYLIKLNIPVLGDYLTDIIEIIEAKRI